MVQIAVQLTVGVGVVQYSLCIEVLYYLGVVLPRVHGVEMYAGTWLVDLAAPQCTVSYYCTFTA